MRVSPYKYIRHAACLVTGVVFLNLSLLNAEIHALDPLLYKNIVNLLSRTECGEESDTSSEGSVYQADDAKCLYKIYFSFTAYSHLISSRLTGFITSIHLLDFTPAIVLPPPEITG